VQTCALPILSAVATIGFLTARLIPMLDKCYLCRQASYMLQKQKRPSARLSPWLQRRRACAPWVPGQRRKVLLSDSQAFLSISSLQQVKTKQTFVIYHHFAPLASPVR